MEELEFYKKVRGFSDIPGLQRSYTITYQFNILPAGANFQIIQTSLHKGQEEMLIFFYPNATYISACQLTNFLYENAICPGQCTDVLRDSNVPFRLLSCGDG